MTVKMWCPGCGAPYAPRSLVVRHSDECPYAPARSRHGCDPVDAVERRRRQERAAWLEGLPEPPESWGLWQFCSPPRADDALDLFDLAENAKAALRVTSGYRRSDEAEAVKRRLFEEMEAAADCERCGGEGKVLDRDFPHGPRWMPCPWCGPATAAEAAAEQAREWAGGANAITESVLAVAEANPPPASGLPWFTTRRVTPWWAKLIAWGIAAYYAVASRS